MLVEGETRSRGTALVIGEDAPSELVATLESAGWDCVVAGELDRARWLASVRSFGLVVVAGASVEWLRTTLDLIRPITISPVLGVTTDLDTGHALMLRGGADLVLAAASGVELVRAATDALVRRAPAHEPELRYLESDGLSLDLWARRAQLEGVQITLTPTEFDLLRFLMAQSQIPVKHHEIIKAVWSWKYTDERNALRLQVNRLRSKLGDGATPFIKSVRGIGYVFDRPVTEFADTRDKPRGEGQQDNSHLLLEGRLRQLIASLTTCGNRAQACATLVDTVVAEGMCDGAAVFARHPHTASLHLVAQAGMSGDWQAAVADGIPLGEQFVASDTVNTRQVHNYVDISRLSGRYPSTARLMRAAQLPAHLSVPLVDRRGAWGQVGFGRRSDSAFTTSQCMVLEAAGAVLGALYADHGSFDTSVKGSSA